MRWYILKTLLYKEALRHATNRGGLMLAGLLVTASLVLSVMNPAGEQAQGLIGGIHHCYIHAEDFDGPWMTHLKQNVPDELKNHILFKKLGTIGPDEMIVYQPGTGAIQVRREPATDDKPQYRVWIWHPKGDEPA